MLSGSEIANNNSSETEGLRRKTGRGGVEKKEGTAVTTGEVSCENTQPAFLSNSANY